MYINNSFLIALNYAGYKRFVVFFKYVKLDFRHHLSVTIFLNSDIGLAPSIHVA